MVAEIVTAEYVSLPRKEPGLFKGRPWVVYYEKAVRSDGKRARCGLMSFKLKREAVRFAFAICPTINEADLPF